MHSFQRTCVFSTPNQILVFYITFIITYSFKCIFNCTLWTGGDFCLVFLLFLDNVDVWIKVQLFCFDLSPNTNIHVWYTRFYEFKKMPYPYFSRTAKWIPRSLNGENYYKTTIYGTEIIMFMFTRCISFRKHVLSQPPTKF